MVLWFADVWQAWGSSPQVDTPYHPLHGSATLISLSCSLLDSSDTQVIFTEVNSTTITGNFLSAIYLSLWVTQLLFLPITNTETISTEIENYFKHSRLLLTILISEWLPWKGSASPVLLSPTYPQKQADFPVTPCIPGLGWLLGISLPRLSLDILQAAAPPEIRWHWNFLSGLTQSQLGFLHTSRQEGDSTFRSSHNEFTVIRELHQPTMPLNQWHLLMLEADLHPPFSSQSQLLTSPLH